MNSIENILNQKSLTTDDIITLLSIDNEAELTALFQKAYQVKEEYIGTKVFYRGIIEFSNICSKNCYYCGIRKDNTLVNRYKMTDDEIFRCARFAWESNYGSIVIQGGELQSRAFTDYITNIIAEIKKLSNNELGITLSLGEQSYKTYQKWFDAGAHRYLLRIETSNDELYRSLHPKSHNFQDRYDSLRYLKEIGYQVGTGMMIGLPNQTVKDLANDILFMKQMDIDMIGMGPFIPHHQTPLANSVGDFELIKSDQLMKSLKVIAVTRIFLKDVNIAATTALQALDLTGREKGIMAGANIIMPNITDTKYRDGYKLYDNKPCTDENSSICKGCLENRINSIDESIGYGEWGDSPHFFKKQKKIQSD